MDTIDFEDAVKAVAYLTGRSIETTRDAMRDALMSLYTIPLNARRKLTKHVLLDPKIWIDIDASTDR
jgi:hypothetical protein